MVSTYYKIINNEENIFKAAVENKLPLLLKGPTGCGKSRFVSYMAEQLGRELFSVVCNDETSATDLLGRYILKGDETVWQDGPVTKAVKSGGILYLDEVVEAREDIISIVHSLTDFRRELYLDKKSEVFKAHDDFLLVISYNPGYQKGLKDLKPSTRQRFVALEFDYPTEKVEKEIVEVESQLEPSMVQKLVKLAHKVRKMQDLQLAETVSTRLVVNTSMLIKSGLPVREACFVGMIYPLTDDEQIISSLKEIVTLTF